MPIEIDEKHTNTDVYAVGWASLLPDLDVLQDNLVRRPPTRVRSLKVTRFQKSLIFRGTSADGASFRPNMSADPFCVGGTALRPSVFVGLLGGGGVLIRHEENLQVRHLVFHHSGDSAICDFAEQRARFC